MPKNKSLRKSINWTANLAYVVGLITTDGNLSSDKRHITFVSTDKDLVITFRQCLGKENTITTSSPSSLSKKRVYRIQISDVKFYKWLNNVGLTQNKSLTLKTLKIPNKYFQDFLRGHLDGDGSVIHYEDKYNAKIKSKYVYDRLFVYFISASEEHIKWLRNKISNILKIKGSASKIRNKNRPNSHFISRIKFSTKEAKILLNWIYYTRDLPCLKRKYKIAKPYLNI